MRKLSTLFCVIDPTTTNQRALARSIGIAEKSKAALHVYVCIAPPGGANTRHREMALKAETERYELWLDRMATPARERGIKVNIEVEAKADWRSAIAPAAQRAGAELIVKGSFRRGALRRQLLKTGDWTLLRGAKCPVMFVKRDEVEQLRQVLLAINLNAKDARHQALNDAVFEYARGVARNTGAELHVVNAYSDSLQFVHPPDLAKKFGVERRQAHVIQGSPDKAIAEVVQKLGQPLVVIGSVMRRGMGGVVVGNTAERILDQIESDVLCVVKPRSS
ncbi:MAG: universal stress protein [Chromatiales bacterium]|nr:universal stress protein [Chromatiales bacterium]